MRRRRTRAQIEQLEAQIYDVLAEDHPQSVRHCFYRLTNPRLPEPVEKSERGYSQLQNRITKMRRDGTLPYGWITDATRRGYFTDTFTDAGDFLSAVHGLYRHDLWVQADGYVEVWAESRSIAGVIEADCRELAVSLYPCGGFSSITLAYEAAQQINHVVTVTGRTPHIIFIGDYDPAGVLIDRSLERELREHLVQDVDLSFHRIAINSEQIEKYNLPTKPRKPGDRRALHVASTVEAEAMPAATLRGLLRAEIERHLPEDALRVAMVAEQSEREGLEILAGMIAKGGIDDFIGRAS